MIGAIDKTQNWQKPVFLTYFVCEGFLKVWQTGIKVFDAIVF